MDDFDFDKAEESYQCSRMTGRDGDAEKDGVVDFSSENIHLPHLFGCLRFQPPARPSSPTSTSRVLPQSNTSEGFISFLEEELGMRETPSDSCVWRSACFTERFSMSEFPLLQHSTPSSSSSSLPIYRFRKFKWATGSPQDQVDSDVGPGFFPGVFKELWGLRCLNSHPNIISLLDVFLTGKSLDMAVVFVFADWGNPLSSILDSKMAKRRIAADPVLVKPLFRQIFEGVHFIHSRRIIHRNLTASSIKVDLKGRVRIGGFNYAIPSGIGVKSATFPEEDFPLNLPDSYEHLAPEILLGSWNYDGSSDIWSLGVLLSSAMLGAPLFMFAEPETPRIPVYDTPNSSLPTILNIFRLFGTPTEELMPGFWKLPYFHFNFPVWTGCFDEIANAEPPMHFRTIAKDMLHLDPSRRLSAAQLLTEFCEER